MNSVRLILERAAETGEAVRIVYHGGSQPGAVREIRPLTVSQSETIALDSTGTRKTFRLERIKLAGAGASYPAYDPALSTDPEDGRPLAAVFMHSVAELEDLGWHVEVANHSVTLSRYFKNGRPRRAPDVSIWFAEFTAESFIELDGTESDYKRHSALPYHVSSPNLSRTLSFQRLSRAVAAFWEEARALAPARAAAEDGRRPAPNRRTGGP